MNAGTVASFVLTGERFDDPSVTFPSPYYGDGVRRLEFVSHPQGNNTLY